MKEILLAMLLAQAGDLATTAIGMTSCSNLREGNPTLNRASINHIAAVKVSAIAGEVTIAWGANKKGHSGGAKAVLITGIGMGTFATIWNTRQIMRCK